MAYEILSASTTGGLAQIRFEEITDSLLNEVKLLTAYRSRTLEDKTGKSDFDEYSLTESERDFFLNALQYVVPEVFSELAKIASGVTDSVFVDDGSSNSVTGFSLIDYEAYDANLLTIIDKRIRKCYILYCLMEWWGHTGLDNIYASYVNQYRESIIILKKKAWTLIKPRMNN
jgi:hypothetical protein